MRSGDTGRKSGFPSSTCCTSARSVSAWPRAKDATPWKSTAITARANLLSGQRVLEDALKQATETAKKGKEGVWSADTYVCAPLHSDTNSYFDFKLESDKVCQIVCVNDWVLFLGMGSGEGGSGVHPKSETRD